MLCTQPTSHLFTLFVLVLSAASTSPLPLELYEPALPLFFCSQHEH